MYEETKAAATTTDVQTAGSLETRCNTASETLDGVKELSRRLAVLVERLDGPSANAEGGTPPRPVRSGLIGSLEDVQEQMDEALKSVAVSTTRLEQLL